ncbi:MAG: competence/damage-inducible protein A, partial [Halobacteriaceae archaeon]
MRVAVVTVGDEIVAGDIVNTNAAWLGKELTKRGVTVTRMITVPDTIQPIADEITRISQAFDAVITTGGLGPTHDDRTMAAVGEAFDREIVDHTEAEEWFKTHSEYEYDDLTEGTTKLPAGARMLPNKEGVAPGAVVENVYVLPGVPEEMKAMFFEIADEFSGDTTYVEFVETEKPESALVDYLIQLEDKFDVTVGSYPGATVRIKIQSENESEAKAAANWIQDQIN